MAVEKVEKKKLFADPKSRNIFITVGVVAVSVLALSMFLSGQAADEVLNSSVVDPGNTGSIPGKNTKPIYQQKVKEANNEAADLAESQGGSAVPTISNTGTPDVAELFNPFEVTQEEQEPEETMMEAYQGGTPIRNVQPQQQQQAYQAPPREVNPAMQSQMRALMGRWSETIPATGVTLNTTLPEPVRVASNEVQEGQSPTEGEVATQDAQDVELLYRAGDIIPAIVDTELSTDYPGKVRATIVSGPLRGTFAIGDFTQQRDTVLLQFTILSLKGKGSIGTQMVAVDPNTGNSGIQSDVDNHYLSRYASLMGGVLAKSLGVYAELTLEEGTTTINNGNGTAVTSRPIRESNDKMLASVAGGIGDTAGDFSDDIREGFNREATVRVFQNEPIGLFVLQDIPADILK